jgi:hypothetical protein
MRAILRPADLSLLADLTDELAMAALFRSHAGVPRAGDAAGLPAHAWQWLEALRASGLAQAACDAAADGHPEALVAFVEQHPIAELSDQALHGLAVYSERVAAKNNSRRAWARSLSSWQSLADRGYLDARARQLGAKEPNGYGERFVLGRLRDVGTKARAGAPARTAEGAAALGALRDFATETSSKVSDAALAARLRQAAQVERSTAIDAATDPIDARVSDSLARGVPHAERMMMLAEAGAVWAFAEGDESVERFVLDRLADIAWELYRAEAWAALRQALRPLAPLIDAAATRIEGDPTRIAYASRCADAVFFQAEVSEGPAHTALAERVLRVCPPHRNGRLILAQDLCKRALNLLASPAPAPFMAEANKLITRAEELLPSSETVAHARKQYERIQGKTP